MGPAGSLTTSALAVLALAATTARAAASKTATTTTSLVLPSIATSADERIYATLLAGGADQDVYSLNCQSDFSASRTCAGAFAGRTLTYGPATVRVDLGGPLGVHDCARGGPGDGDAWPLTCRVSAGTAGTFTAAAATTLDDEARRATPVTVLGPTGKAKSKARPQTRTITTDGRTITTTVAAATSDGGSSAATATPATGGACKRDLHPRKAGGHSGGSDADTGTAGGGGDEADDGTTAAAASPRRKGGGGCSAGSRVEGVEWLGGLVGWGLLVLAFAI